MMPLLFLIAISAQTPCVGPACRASSDTETVQRIWVSNENRYGVGVIRNGKFVEATPDPATAATPAATPTAGATSTGTAINYGLIPPAAWNPHVQGYTSNDTSFRPPLPDPAPDPNTDPGANANPYGMPIFILSCAFAAALVLAAIFAALMKGPSP
jgi:hypothetical protein